LKKAAADYESLKQRCEQFDAELMADLRQAGGEKYARIAALVPLPAPAPPTPIGIDPPRGARSGAPATPPGPRIASATIGAPGSERIAASALRAIPPACAASTSANFTLGGVGVTRGADVT